jgi:hypothetical protein
MRISRTTTVNTMIDQGLAPQDWNQDNGMNFDLTNFMRTYTKNDGTIARESVL